MAGVGFKQPYLPFEFVAQEKTKEAKQKAEYERRIEEDIARLPYFPEPKNDHQRLFNLQWKYKHGDQNALNEMYKLTFAVCYKIVYHKVKRSKDIRIRRMSYTDKLNKAEDAATYFIEQYIKRPDFMRHDSILSYLFKRVTKEIYYSRKVDRIVEFVDFTKFYKNSEDYDDEG